MDEAVLAIGKALRHGTEEAAVLLYNEKVHDLLHLDRAMIVL